MSITDELRKYAHEFYPTANTKLLEIADRIDEEHEKGCTESRMRGHDVWASVGNEGVMAKRGWVRLPVDADGVPIRFGDKIMVMWDKGKVFEVAGFSYTKQLVDGKIIIWVDVYSLEKKANVPLCPARNCRHYHAPTVEDVLNEMLDVYCSNDSRTPCQLVAEYAAKLQIKEVDK